jgi:hypothetical protein
MIDVGRLGGDAVQLDDSESAPGAKRVDAAVHPHIESAEVEAVEATGNSVESLFERRRQHLAAVEEQRASAMAAELRQRHRLTASWYALQRVTMAVEIKLRGADSSLVVQNQLFECPATITYDKGESLFRNGEDVPASL